MVGPLPCLHGFCLNEPSQGVFTAGRYQYSAVNALETMLYTDVSSSVEVAFKPLSVATDTINADSANIDKQLKQVAALHGRHMLASPLA